MPEKVVNPLFQTGFFIFSNMYDDSLITDFYKKICNESYDNTIRAQYNAIGRRRMMKYHPKVYGVGLIDSIKVDDIFNNRVGIPMGSSICKLSNIVIPYYDKKKFLRVYGSGIRKIPLNDFLIRTDIFDNSINVQIGKFRIFEAYIIETTDRLIYLAIPNSVEYGIPSSQLTKLLEDAKTDSGSGGDANEYNNMIQVYLDEQSQVYKQTNTITKIVPSAASENTYDITVPISAKLNNIGKQVLHLEANSWDCYASLNTSKFSKAALISTSCTLKQQLTDRLIFSVSNVFIDYIKSNNSTSSIDMLFMKKPNRRHITIYKGSEETAPYINLDFDYNPNSIITTEIYNYDDIHQCRLGRIPPTDNKGKDIYGNQIYFPNIMSFNNITSLNISNVLIEVSEYYPSYVSESLYNSMKDIISSLGNDFYTNCVVNDYVTHDGHENWLKEFHPLVERVSIDDYYESPYKENIRGYILDKVCNMILKDGGLYLEYLKWMDKYNKVMCTEVGTPKLFRFGTSGSGEFSGKHGIVNDTSIASINPDDVLKFEIPHSYIVYHGEGGNIPSMFYLDGKYVEPTTMRYYKGEVYLFFPSDTIYNALTEYSESELKELNPLRLDFFPNCYQNYSDTPKDSFTIDSLEDVVHLFAHIKNPYFSLSNITLYDAVTGEFIDLDEFFNILYEVPQYVIDNPLEQDPIIIDKASSTIQYLLTSLNEIYCTMDKEPIIMGYSSIDIDFDDEIDKLIDSGAIDESMRNLFFYKKLDFSKITLVPKNSSLIGRTINVYVNTFRSSYYFKGNQFTDNEDGTFTVTLPDGAIDRNRGNYFLFKNGEYVEATISNPPLFVKDITITVTTDAINPDDNFTMVHTPIDFNKVKNVIHESSRLWYKGNINTEGMIKTDIWPIIYNSDTPDYNSSGYLLLNEKQSMNEIHGIDAYCSLIFGADKITNCGLRYPMRSEDMNAINSIYYKGRSGKWVFDRRKNDNYYIYSPVIGAHPFLINNEKNINFYKLDQNIIENDKLYSEYTSE